MKTSVFLSAQECMGTWNLHATAFGWVLFTGVHNCSLYALRWGVLGCLCPCHGNGQLARANSTNHPRAWGAARSCQERAVTQNTWGLALASYCCSELRAQPWGTRQAGQVGVPLVFMGVGGHRGPWKLHPCPEQMLWRCWWRWIGCPFLPASGTRKKKREAALTSLVDNFIRGSCVCVAK